MPYQSIIDYSARVNPRLFITVILSVILMACHKKAENPNHPAYIDSVINHADSLSNYGKPDQSNRYLDSVYQALKTPGPVDLWKKYQQKCNYYLNTEIDINKARLYADSMTIILKNKNESYDEKYANATTFFSIAQVFMAEKKYNEAFKSYYDGKIFASKNLDSCIFCQFSYELGLVRYRQGQYLKAIPHLKQAIAENSHCKAGSGFYNLYFKPQSYINTLALCYERSEQSDSAIYYYKQGLKFIDEQALHFPGKKQFTETAKGIFYGNIGGVYARLKDYKNAEKYLKANIQLNDRVGHPIEDAQTAKIKLIELYLLFEQYLKANVVLKEVEKDLSTGRGKSTENTQVWADWYRLKWKYADKTHNVSTAYSYQQKYYRLRDSLREVIRGLASVDMDGAFKNNDEQYKLALLSKNNKLKTVYLLSVIIVSLMTIGILLAVWFNLKRSRKNVAELTKLNRLVTDQNTQMQHALTALEQSQEDNHRIMKMVAHDLKSPISSTISITSLLLDAGNHTDEDKDLLQLMKTSNMQSIDMITDLLNMNTRAESLKKELVKMDVLLKHCVDMLKFKAAEKKQSISLVTEEISIQADREKIWRVVSNLIMNAIKFSPEGAAIGVGLRRQNGTIQILIQDHGIGIPGGLKDKIFTMFAGARRPGTSGEESFGLGLAISRQIVEAHSGEIWVESEPGKGTTFFVELPAGANLN